MMRIQKHLVSKDASNPKKRRVNLQISRTRSAMMANSVMKAGLMSLVFQLFIRGYGDDHGFPLSCMIAYDEGGIAAVLRSPDCRGWVLSSDYLGNSSRTNCPFATLQGHREYQEDRVSCNLDLKLLFSVDGRPEEISVGIAAIFDGHGGSEASEIASKKLIDYFLLHASLNLHRLKLPSHKRCSADSCLGESLENSVARILEEALVRTIRDIDAEFTEEAYNRGYISGTTCVAVLLFNGRFLVANVGDSKAFMCTEKVPHQQGSTSPEPCAEELTVDHKPDREDERARIEATNGFVLDRGVPRVNGVLAVSRAIGDVYLKRYGVTADAEVTGWRSLPEKSYYLVVASDGVYETLSPQNVCDLMYTGASSELAESDARNALRSGSMDNLSVIVIPGEDKSSSHENKFADSVFV